MDPDAFLLENDGIHMYDRDAMIPQDYIDKVVKENQEQKSQISMKDRRLFENRQYINFLHETLRDTQQQTAYNTSWSLSNMFASSESRSAEPIRSHVEEIARLNNVNDQLFTESEQLVVKNNSMETKNGELQRQLQQTTHAATTAMTANMDMVRRIQQLGDEAASKDAAAAKAQAEMLQEIREVRGLTARNSPTVADSEIRQQWGQLAFLVKDFVRRHVPKSIENGGEAFIRQFRDLVYRPDIALPSPFFCPLVIEARIWQILEIEVFGVDSSLWAGDLGRSLGQMVLHASRKY